MEGAPFWIAFNAFILSMIALDLFVLNRKPHEIRVKEALLWTAFWVALALGFGALVYVWRGHRAALEYITCYLIEESLSIDNIFVFLMIFSYFGVPQRYRHRVLFWGILGAIAMRAVFIVLGTALLSRLHWMVYIFGAFLIYTAARMARGKREVRPERNAVLRLLGRLMPVAKAYDEGRFFTKVSGRRFATPLFVVLIAIETTDIIFAIDSIPAVLSISRDIFIVYTSNIFAVLGLRSIFFALAGLMERFRYLHYGLAVVLAFTGLKMLLSDVVEIPVHAALVFIVAVLAASVVASVLKPPGGTGK